MGLFSRKRGRGKKPQRISEWLESPGPKRESIADWLESPGPKRETTADWLEAPRAGSKNKSSSSTGSGGSKHTGSIPGDRSEGSGLAGDGGNGGGPREPDGGTHASPSDPGGSPANAAPATKAGWITIFAVVVFFVTLLLAFDEDMRSPFRAALAVAGATWLGLSVLRWMLRQWLLVGTLAVMGLLGLTAGAVFLFVALEETIYCANTWNTDEDIATCISTAVPELATPFTFSPALVRPGTDATTGGAYQLTGPSSDATDWAERAAGLGQGVVGALETYVALADKESREDALRLPNDFSRPANRDEHDPVVDSLIATTLAKLGVQDGDAAAAATSVDTGDQPYPTPAAGAGAVALLRPDDGQIRFQSCFSELYPRHVRRAKAFLRVKELDAHMADDIVMGAMLRVCETHMVRPLDPLPPYYRKAVFYKLIDTMRLWMRERPTDELPELLQPCWTLPVTLLANEGLFFQRAWSSALKKEHRTVIREWWRGGSWRQIGQRVGMTDKQARDTFQAGVRRMGRFLKAKECELPI